MQMSMLHACISAKVLDAMGDEDAVEELFKQDPLQEGLR